MRELCVLTLVRSYEQHFPFTLHYVMKTTMASELFRSYEVNLDV